MEKSTSTCLFDKMYAASKEKIIEGKKETIRAKLVRKFESARDNAKDAVLAAKEDLQTATEDLAKYDLNTVINLQQKIRDEENTITIIEAHHLEMFGEVIRK